MVRFDGWCENAKAVEIPQPTWGKFLELAEVPTTQPLDRSPPQTDLPFEVILCQERLERLVRTDEVGDVPTKIKTGGVGLVICTR